MILKNKIDPFINEVTFRSDLIAVRINVFTDESAAEFSAAVSLAHDSGQPILPVIIDSPGGSVDSLMSMISDIESSEIPIATIGVGKAMSCGAVLLSCGTRGFRFADSRVNVMIHEVAIMDYEGGKLTDVAAMSEDLNLINEKVFKILASNCGKKDEYFVNQMKKRKNADWHLDAKEALALGLVDYVGMPSMTRRVIQDFSFELNGKPLI